MTGNALLMGWRSLATGTILCVVALLAYDVTQHGGMSVCNEWVAWCQVLLWCGIVASSFSDRITLLTMAKGLCVIGLAVCAGLVAAGILTVFVHVIGWVWLGLDGLFYGVVWCMQYSLVRAALQARIAGRR
jgi:hypothetical protein